MVITGQVFGKPFDCGSEHCKYTMEDCDLNVMKECVVLPICFSFKTGIPCILYSR